MSESESESNRASDYESNEKQLSTGDYRRSTVYNAVAGRLTAPGTGRQVQTAIPPEEAIFRSNGAPIRNVQNELYYANKKLGDEQRQADTLPESDLLKALHSFTSDYYATSAEGIDASSMYGGLDASALIAMGILVEEEIARAMGKTGYLAFLEAGTENVAANAACLYDDGADPSRPARPSARLKGPSKASRSPSKVTKGFRTSKAADKQAESSSSLERDHADVLDTTSPARPSKRRKLEEAESAIKR